MQHRRGDGAAEDDVDPRAGEDGGEGDRVGGGAEVGGGRGQLGRGGVGGQAAVGDALLDQDRHAGGVRAGEGVAGAALVQVPGRLDGVEGAQLDGTVDRRRLLGCRLSTIRSATPSARSSASSASTSASSSTPDSIVAEWIAYMSSWSPSSERVCASCLRSCAASSCLRSCTLGVHPPVADVGVAPLGRDRQRARGDRAIGQPAGEELLRQAVGAGGVDPADTGRERRVEQLPRLRAQRLAGAVRSEVFVTSKVDVRRPPDGGEPETDLRHGTTVCIPSTE